MIITRSKQYTGLYQKNAGTLVFSDKSAPCYQGGSKVPKSHEPRCAITVLVFGFFCVVFGGFSVLPSGYRVVRVLISFDECVLECVNPSLLSLFPPPPSLEQLVGCYIG